MPAHPRDRLSRVFRHDFHVIHVVLKEHVVRSSRLHDFESLPDKTAGNLTVADGESITFKYRIFMHAGDEKEGKVAEKYQDYLKQKKE